MIINNKFNNILICGDIHREYDVVPNFIRDKKLNNVAVIVVGDFGVGFDVMRKDIKGLNYLNNRMKHSNSTLFSIRGNHDNPIYFNGNFDLSHVKLVPDYTILNLNSNNILCIGGAISVDRKKRKSYFKPNSDYNKNDELNPNDYWKSENVFYDYDKVDKIKNIDYVITHTAPSIAYPYIKDELYNWSLNDAHLIKDVEEERRNLHHIYNQLINNKNKIKKWYYGHFHKSYKLPYKNTEFIALDINEIVEL